MATNFFSVNKLAFCQPRRRVSSVNRRGNKRTHLEASHGFSRSTGNSPHGSGGSSPEEPLVVSPFKKRSQKDTLFKTITNNNLPKLITHNRRLPKRRATTNRAIDFLRARRAVPSPRSIKSIQFHTSAHLPSKETLLEGHHKLGSMLKIIRRLKNFYQLNLKMGVSQSRQGGKKVVSLMDVSLRQKCFVQSRIIEVIKMLVSQKKLISHESSIFSKVTNNGMLGTGASDGIFVIAKQKPLQCLERKWPVGCRGLEIRKSEIISMLGRLEEICIDLKYSILRVYKQFGDFLAHVKRISDGLEVMKKGLAEYDLIDNTLRKVIMEIEDDIKMRMMRGSRKLLKKNKISKYNTMFNKQMNLRNQYARPMTTFARKSNKGKKYRKRKQNYLKKSDSYRKSFFGLNGVGTKPLKRHSTATITGGKHRLRNGRPPMTAVAKKRVELRRKCAKGEHIEQAKTPRKRKDLMIGRNLRTSQSARRVSMPPRGVPRSPSAKTYSRFKKATVTPKRKRHRSFKRRKRFSETVKKKKKVVLDDDGKELDDSLVNFENDICCWEVDDERE